MHSYISIQTTYHELEMALFANQTLQEKISADQRHTSKIFIPLLDQLLKNNNLVLTDLSFFAVNCGPGPFSTLRSIIASANGLHCATNIPLISVDGLHATFVEFFDRKYAYTVVLLNAFNNDVYYLIAHHDTVIHKGYKKIDIFLTYLQENFPSQEIYFFGNGTTLHEQLIKKTLLNNAIIITPTPQICSIETIGSIGLQKFMANSMSDEYLTPLHLKKHPVEEQ